MSQVTCRCAAKKGNAIHFMQEGSVHGDDEHSGNARRSLFSIDRVSGCDLECIASLMSVGSSMWVLLLMGNTQ